MVPRSGYCSFDRVRQRRYISYHFQTSSTLTVYVLEGVLLRCSQGIRSRVTLQPESTSLEDSDSDLVYPLTPPLSDSSESRPMSPRYEDIGVDLGGVTINASESSATGKQSGRQRSVLTRRRIPRMFCSSGVYYR